MPAKRARGREAKGSDAADESVNEDAYAPLDAVPGIDPEIVNNEDRSGMDVADANELMRLRNERLKDNVDQQQHHQQQQILDANHVDNLNALQIAVNAVANDDKLKHFLGQNTATVEDQRLANRSYQTFMQQHGEPNPQQQQEQMPHHQPIPASQQDLITAERFTAAVAAAAAANNNNNNNDDGRGIINHRSPSDGTINNLNSGTNPDGKRRVRLGWTEKETQYLMAGCREHGVGNWKKILMDPHYQFNSRTAVDLKDRFRTSFPEEYARLYPNARTHKSKRTSNAFDVGVDLAKINRKERRSFSPEEDADLLRGFERHGPAWSKIQKDASLNFQNRRSTDLRDRFRNAFPEKYAEAGYKGRNARRLAAAGASSSDKEPISNGEERMVPDIRFQQQPNQSSSQQQVPLQYNNNYYANLQMYRQPNAVGGEETRHN